MIAAVCVLLWLGFGILGAGWNYAYFQGRYPELAKENRRQDLGGALMLVCMGPIYAFIEFFMSGFGEHGWRLR